MFHRVAEFMLTTVSTLTPLLSSTGVDAIIVNEDTVFRDYAV